MLCLLHNNQSDNNLKKDLRTYDLRSFNILIYTKFKAIDGAWFAVANKLADVC